MSAAKAPPRWHGLLLIDKPGGWTSHDVVARVRRLAGQKRVGHTGTLDPMATGLMAVLLGAATRLEPYLTKMDKTYSGRVELGLSTDSDDITGNVLSRSSGPWPEAEAALLALKSREGEGAQLPPAYSAIKVGGLRAYKAARAGRPLELAPRRVTAYRLEMTAYAPPFLDFRAEVSSGYYIRSLARDLGADLGPGGALTSLRRESVGPWPVSRAVTLEEVAQWSEEDWRARLLPPAEALPHLPGLTLEEEAARAFCQGRLVDVEDLDNFQSSRSSAARRSEATCSDRQITATSGKNDTFCPITSLQAKEEASFENIVDNGPIKVLNAKGLLIGLGELITASIGGPEKPRRPFLRPLRVFSNGAE